jgi:hypothetical protein
MDSRQSITSEQVSLIAKVDSPTIDPVVKDESIRSDFTLNGVATATAATTATDRWLLFYGASRREIAFSPPVTESEVKRLHPDADHAEPYEPVVIAPLHSLTQAERINIIANLNNVDEHDQKIVSLILKKCEVDQEARSYFLNLKPLRHPDV